VFFSIDGLADTNHLYRRKVSFNKAIDNAKAFINAGGKAYWNYIVFKHNQHQVEEAHALSKELGFADFNIKRTSRFFNKKHEIQQTLAVYSEAGEVEYHIEIPTDPQYINSSYSKIEFIKTKDTLKNYFKNTSVTCKSKNLKKLYLSADGYVFPCGWLADRIYGYEVESNNDTVELDDLFQHAGGKHLANVNHTDIHQIINGKWFDTLESSWSNDNKLERCGAICGDQIDLINDQNELVKIY
jgi:MoaA/NifB/PqqE/SkfB family radical SAM enzyme